MFKNLKVGTTLVSTLGRKVPKRADARKNIAAILDAATACLAIDPDVSVNEIARVAGVGRVTLYGHFDSRATLVSEVAARAIAHTEQALESLDLRGDSLDALARLLETTWHLTHRYGALVVAAEHVMGPQQLHEAHQQLRARAEKLLRRGRRSGQFRRDMPISWQVTTIQSIIHGASAAVHRGEITGEAAPKLIRDTVLASLASRQSH